MKKFQITISILFYAILISCNPFQKIGKDPIPESQQPVSSNEDTDTIPKGHNSRNSLDWAGTYQGVVPCADCEGIYTSVTLFNSGKYTRTVTYLGREEKGTTDNGDFVWNDTGSIVTLHSKNGNNQMYQVGENVLYHIDRQGKRIDGDLAEKYILKKNVSDPRLEDRDWVLKELMGEKVSFKGGKKKVSITFHSELAKITGNNSCNLFTASYELGELNQIKLGHIATTLMACENMEIASKFNEVLEKADNYSINDGILSLNKAKMAPLARFKVEDQD